MDDLFDWRDNDQKQQEKFLNTLKDIGEKGSFYAKTLDMIRATECTLFSHHLKIAGTCDLIADYDGRLSIIDYKTSTKRKRKDWIEGYFLQCSLYAYMLWEMTGIAVKDIVIVIGVVVRRRVGVVVGRVRRVVVRVGRCIGVVVRGVRRVVVVGRGVVVGRVAARGVRGVVV